MKNEFLINISTLMIVAEQRKKEGLKNSLLTHSWKHSNEVR